MSRNRRPDYTPAFDRAEDGVRRWFARHLEELDAAAALAVDLLDAPEAGRRELLRQPQLQARKGDTEEVQRLTAEMLPIFESRDVHSEALAALVLLRQAVESEEISLEILEQLALQFRRVQSRS